MTFRLLVAAALAAVLLGAAPPPKLLDYSSPAGVRPAGADALLPTDAVLPDGRIAAPAGRSVFVGTNPLGFALSPSGRYAIVSNDDDRSGGFVLPASNASLAIGYSLAVVDTRTMRVVDVYHNPAFRFFMGVASVPNPQDPSTALVFASDGGAGVIRVFTLDARGQLTPQPQAVGLPSTGGFPAFPAGLSASPGGKTIYAVDNLGGTLDAIDVATRTVVASVRVGYFPFSVTAGVRRVFVSGGGLAAYTRLRRPLSEPLFGAPPFNPDRSSALTIFDRAGGTLANPAVVRMDDPPNGTATIGGAVPGSIALASDGKVAYVVMSGVDRVAVVHVGAAPHVVRGLDLRLYPRAPYGALPSAALLSPHDKRLYVALAGLNAVAVLAAQMPLHYRYGLIPTGWFPTALARSPKGRYLYVLDTKGVDGFGMLQRVDVKHLPLVKTTLSALRYNRTPRLAKANALVPPLRSGKRSTAITHVVVIGFGQQGYDEMLGDLRGADGAPYGNGDPTFNVYSQRITPNLHALARTFALADNFYAADPNPSIARAAMLGMASPLYAQFVAAVARARGAMGGSDDPEDEARVGDLFNAFARAGLSFRSYGAMLDLSGRTVGGFDVNVPAAAVLSGNADLAYHGSPARRAREFEADMRRAVAAGTVPSFAYVSLPATRADMHAADAALGSMVAFLSRSPQWNSTAIFIAPQGTDLASDHVNLMRSYAIVVSPLAKRGFVGKLHLAPAGIVKTVEEIFGLPPLGLGDLLSSDFSGFFTAAADPTPYRARP